MSQDSDSLPTGDLLETARRAARRAGELQRERFGDPGRVEQEAVGAVSRTAHCG